MESIEPSFTLLYADQILKFICMFLVGGLLVGIPSYLSKLPKDEAIMWRYLVNAFLLHGGTGSIAGVMLLFTPIDNILVLTGLSALFAHIGVEPIKKIAIKLAMKKLGINGINGNSENGIKK